MDTVHHHSISDLHQQIHFTINNVLRSVFNDEENDHSFHLEEFSLINENNSNDSSIQEEPKTKSLSQIDKFNKKYQQFTSN